MTAYHGYPLEEFAGTNLAEYQRLLSTDARRLGLIGFSNSQLPTEILRSLLFADIIPEGARVIDVGSGAGLPGIPLGILRGGVDLVEPHVRAVGFLEKVIRTLSLDVRVHLGTAEQVAQRGDCQPADYVVARALAPSSEAARICADVCKPGGQILLSARSEESQPSLDPRFQWEGTMSIKGPGIVQRVNVITLKSTL